MSKYQMQKLKFDTKEYRLIGVYFWMVCVILKYTRTNIYNFID